MLELLLGLRLMLYIYIYRLESVVHILLVKAAAIYKVDDDEELCRKEGE